MALYNMPGVDAGPPRVPVRYPGDVVGGPNPFPQMGLYPQAAQAAANRASLLAQMAAHGGVGAAESPDQLAALLAALHAAQMQGQRPVDQGYGPPPGTVQQPVDHGYGPPPGIVQDQTDVLRGNPQSGGFLEPYTGGPAHIPLFPNPSAASRGFHQGTTDPGDVLRGAATTPSPSPMDFRRGPTPMDFRQSGQSLLAKRAARPGRQVA